MIFKMQANDNAVSRSHSDFSIEHILNRAGGSSAKNFPNSEQNPENNTEPFSWLQCSRFCPPRIPRVQKKLVPQRRQLARYPRIPFTSHQIALLEEKFQESNYLSSEEAITLSNKLQLTDAKVKIWFQNRRARKRREEMSEEKKEQRTIRSSCPSFDILPPSSTATTLDDNPTTSFVQSTVQHMPFIYITAQNILEFNNR